MACWMVRVPETKIVKLLSVQTASTGRKRRPLHCRMKTKLIQRAVVAGYACMFLDVDQVMFKDPFSQIKPEVRFL